MLYGTDKLINVQVNLHLKREDPEHLTWSITVTQSDAYQVEHGKLAICSREEHFFEGIGTTTKHTFADTWEDALELQKIAVQDAINLGWEVAQFLCEYETVQPNWLNK